MFQVGDLVKLKSGGPVMTVSWINNENTGCNWFNQNDELRTANFRHNELRLISDNEI